MYLADTKPIDIIWMNCRNNMEKNSLVIFAGGKGTRLGDAFGNIPKALVQINGIPIIEYILKHVNEFNINDFYILTGHKSELIRQYFLDRMYTDDVTIDFQSNSVKANSPSLNWKVNIVDTGINSSTQNRLFQVKDRLLSYSNSLITYSDCISNVDIEALYLQHIKSENYATLTAVQIDSKYGDLKLVDEQVVNFSEKSTNSENWVNGGYIFFSNKAILEIPNSSEMLEEDYLPKLANKGRLGAYFHNGFWKSMDTAKDQQELNSLLENRNWPES